MADVTRQVPQVQRLNYNGESIGMGFNSDTGVAIGNPLEFTIPTGENAQEVEADVSIVSSHEELASRMHLSAQLEGHYSIVSAGGKTDFLQSTAYNSTSTFVLAKMVISNIVNRGEAFKLRDDVRGILERDKDAFKSAFGDSFVRAQFKGGEFYVVMRITSVDAKTESKLAVSAHAAVQGGIAGGSFQLDLDKANTSENTRSDFSVSFYQKGGAGENEIGTTLSIDEIKKRLQNFPSAVQNHPFPYFIEVARWDTLPLPLDVKFQQEAFLDALDDATKQKLAFLQGKNDCEFAADHPEFFLDPPAPVTLRADAEIYTQLVNAVIEHAISITNGAPPLLFDPGKLTPPLVVPSVSLLKKDLGVASTFVQLWIDKDKPGIPTDTYLLANSVGRTVAQTIHGFFDLKDPSGDAEATLRLQGEVLGKALGSVRKFSYANLAESDNRHMLTSLAALPDMLPASIQSLQFLFNDIQTTLGLDYFRLLTNLDLTWNSLETIEQIGALTLLKRLVLTANQITNLQPLSSCTLLEELDISGNQITDLTPLASCKSLKVLRLAGGVAINNSDTRPTGNPITNVLPIAAIPAMANPFTLGTTLAVRVGKLSAGPDAQYRGTATRIGSSHQFRVHLTCGTQSLEEVWSLQSIGRLEPPYDTLFIYGGGLLTIVQPWDLPLSGVVLDIQRNQSQASNYCFVSDRDPKIAVADLAVFPGFSTSTWTTIDATVLT